MTKEALTCTEWVGLLRLPPLYKGGYNTRIIYPTSTYLSLAFTSLSWSLLTRLRVSLSDLSLRCSEFSPPLPSTISSYWVVHHVSRRVSHTYTCQLHPTLLRRGIHFTCRHEGMLMVAISSFKTWPPTKVVISRRDIRATSFWPCSGGAS